jgi:hypothetical protein
MADLVLQTGIGGAVLGMVLIVLGVITGALFLPGVIVLVMATFVIAAGGVLSLLGAGRVAE